jgi:Zn-dependent oligopeptidase
MARNVGTMGWIRLKISRSYHPVVTPITVAARHSGMPENGSDEADEAEESRTRQDYVVAKHERAAKPVEVRARDARVREVRYAGVRPLRSGVR